MDEDNYWQKKRGAAPPTTEESEPTNYWEQKRVSTPTTLEEALPELAPKGEEKPRTRKEILSNPELKQIFLDDIMARQGGENLASVGGRIAGTLAGGKFVQLGGDETEEELFDRWLDLQRSLSVGQSSTLANEVARVATSDPEKLSVFDKGYKLFDSLENAITGDTTIGQKADAIWDYTSNVVWDPTTVGSAFVGKGYAFVAQKGGAVLLKNAVEEGAKLVLKNTFEDAVKRGITKKGAEELAKAAAKKASQKAYSEGLSAIRNNAIKKELVPQLATDFVLETGKDVLYQNKVLMKTDENREYSFSQTAVAGLGAVALPAVIYGAKGIVKSTEKAANQLAKTFKLENQFKTYKDVSAMATRSTSKEIKEYLFSKINKEEVATDLRKTFTTFDRGEGKYPSWKEAKEKAKAQLEAEGIELKTTTPQDNFYSGLFLGIGSEEGDALTGGLAHALKRDGIAFRPLDEEDKFSNFMGDVVSSLDDSLVKELVEKFEKTTGESLGIGYTAESVGNFWKLTSSKSGTTNNLNSLASRIVSPGATFKDLAENAEDVVAGNSVKKKDKNGRSVLGYLLSTRNRLMTAHASTTAINIRGWQGMSIANMLGDAVEGSLNIVTGKVTGNDALLQKGKGSLYGVGRKAFNVLDWNATYKEAEDLLTALPSIEKDLFRVLSGDVGAEDARAFYKVGTENAAINALEGYTQFAQKVAFVNIQDRQTKLISFISNMDMELMKQKGVSYSEFMANPRWQSEVKTADFIKVYDTALDRTLKETGAYSWSDKVGRSPALQMAKAIERFSNNPVSGWVLPFGRWFNTATAFTSDFTGASFLYNAAVKKKNPLYKNYEEATDLTADFAKAAVFWSGVALYTNDAEEKINTGLSWRMKVHGDGTKEDISSQFPENIFSFAAQAVAHWKKDGKVPPELLEDGIGSLLLTPFKSTSQTQDEIKGILKDAIDGDVWGAGTELISKMVSSSVSASLRPLDQANVATMLFTEDYENPDRRQGNKLFNEAVRYIDQWAPMQSELPQRMDPTKGGSVPVDVPKRFSGTATVDIIPLADRMIASTGKQNYVELKWQGEDVVKNRLDEILSTVINEVARDKVGRFPDFFDKPLADRKDIVTAMVKESKDVALSIFKSGVEERDRSLVLLRELGSLDKEALKQAQEAMGIDDPVDLLAEPGGQDVLETLLFTAKAYKDRWID